MTRDHGPAVEFSLGKINGSFAKDLVGLRKLAVLAFQSLEFRNHIRRDTGSIAIVALDLFTHSCSVCAVQPIWAAIGKTATEPWSNG